MTLLQAEQSETDSPDYQVGALLRDLARPIAWQASAGLVKTAVLTAVSFGIAPLLLWPGRLRDLIDAERIRYLQLAAWMRSISGDRSDRLAIAAERIRPNAILSYAPGVLAMVVIVAFAIMFGDGRMTPPRVMESTWLYGQSIGRSDTMTRLFAVWTFGLSLAYLLHWGQLLVHKIRVRDAIVEFNHLIAAEGLMPVPVPAGYGVRPAWLFAGVLTMAGASALWAMPLALCGALQNRYARIAVPAVQGQLGLRVRQLLSRRRPAMFVPTPVSQARRCINERCRAPIARVASFCPRCGTHVGPEVNSLA
jgi:hypothetical protein